MDLSESYMQENALILLKGIWYSELPAIIDFDSMSAKLLNALENMRNIDGYEFDDQEFIHKFKGVVSPEYIRPLGAECITYYDFKNNGSLREMQIPNLKLYMAFIYNTLHVYEDIFEKLYTNENNKEIIGNSNSYLVFEKSFEIHSEYDDSVLEFEAGVFADKNNKISGSAMLNKNRKSYYTKQASYLYKMKIDLESFFPNLYTHYFHRIFNKEPFVTLNVPENYFKFLDNFHQKINDNQTKGIPAGVFSSHVAAELCMLCVDYKIKNLIKDLNVSYIRYVDDFTFFSNSKEQLEDLKIKIQQILNEFRLRINGNKTEIIQCIYDYPQIDREELTSTLKWLSHTEDEVIAISDSNLIQLKKYIALLIKQKNYSQVKSCLTLLEKRISNQEIKLSDIEISLFLYMMQLSQTNVVLASRAYGVINAIIKSSECPNDYKDRLIAASNDVNLKFFDTILQIWHYYVLLDNFDDLEVEQILNIKNCNPIILTMLVKDGSNVNRELFNYIVEEYKKSIANQDKWKSEIMYSKFWLPLFAISLHDPHNYDGFYSLECYPDILKKFKI